MKERPINYTAEMMVARIAERKTNTRRLIRGNIPVLAVITERSDEPGRFLVEKWLKSAREMGNFGRCENIKSPFGIGGDRLWTREKYEVTWWGRKGRAVSLRGYYLADNARFDVVLTPDEALLFLGRKRKIGRMSGRFMYRSLSRGLDEIISVRAEKVQDISEGDAKAEGVPPAQWFEPAGRPLHEHHNVDGVLSRKPKTYRNAFATLWEKIHGPGAWERNEWVWVIKFRRIK